MSRTTRLKLIDGLREASPPLCMPHMHEPNEIVVHGRGGTRTNHAVRVRVAHDALKVRRVHHAHVQKYSI